MIYFMLAKGITASVVLINNKEFSSIINKNNVLEKFV